MESGKRKRKWEREEGESREGGRKEKGRERRKDPTLLKELTELKQNKSEPSAYLIIKREKEILTYLC